MQDIIILLIGIVVLILGVPLGNWLAKVTNDEQIQGEFWFRAVIFVALIGGFISLIVENDVLLFTFFFIAIVTSRSLRK